jgi:plastocyanin
MTRSLMATVVALLLLVGGGCDRTGGADDVATDTTLLDRITVVPRGVNLHLVRMVTRGETYAFEPAEIPVRAGDLVRFVMVTSQPQSVSFELAELSPEAQQFVRDNDLLHGELLTGAGEVYDVSFAGAPPGHYRFLSIVHAERGMRGVVIVDGESAGGDR